MSLNSLQDDMSRRAASMAAMAKRATNPQEIQAIQKSLITGVQNGSIQPYVGVPLIQELTKKLTEAKAQMAQSMAGMQQNQQDQQAPQQPIAQQVMQQAESQGLEALPSNLPQEYAGGGIIAFEHGGPVERYQNRGYTGDPFGMGGSEIMSAAGTADPYVGRNFLEGLLSVPEEPEWKRKLKVEQAIKERDMAMGVKPPATPAANQYPPSDATRRSMFAGQAQPLASAATPPSSIPGGGGFKMPTMQTYTPTITAMPERTMEPLTDLGAITKDMDKKTKTASEAAVKEAQIKLEGFDEPGFKAREEKFGKREAAQEKDSAMGRALSLMSLGFGIAGSKERTLAGALGNEGRQGIRDLIQGEAANRAARDRLEDARDNFEQQKVAAKKGNYSAAQAAGKDAANDLRSATQMALAAAQAGNSQGIQMYSALQQGDIGRATVGNQGEQLKLSAVGQQNTDARGIAGLGLQAQQLAQTGAFQNKQLGMMDKASQARMAQVRAGAIGKFMETQGGQLNAQLAKEYGPNWRTATDPRSLQAQMLFKQAQNAYVMDALGQYDDRSSARDSSEL